VNLANPDVGGNFVADGDVDDVAGDELVGPDALETPVANDFGDFRLVFFQRLDGVFGVLLLPDADDGVGYEDEKDDEGFDVGGDLLLLVVVLLEDGQRKRDDGGEEENLD